MRKFPLTLCWSRARSFQRPSKQQRLRLRRHFQRVNSAASGSFRICAKSLLGIDPANCRVASSDRLALAHGSLALRVSANLSDHSLSTAVLALLTRSCPSRRLRRTAEMGGNRTSITANNRRRHQFLNLARQHTKGHGCSTVVRIPPYIQISPHLVLAHATIRASRPSISDSVQSCCAQISWIILRLCLA